ncbi:SERINE-THREONINE PROTEIN KINASE [Salix purpurea]|uniref:non-specific serine/threonine protein kinase n=1 Tax=Salix purpurea TaxID=77065 RepID=A0A9Q0ZFI4_SALPP|nr:SERINE-THREONINE PROTEIN KINASE [Salix purpurea]
MSKMKHLLRKLHIGDHHNRLGGETRPVSSSNTSPSTTPSSSNERIEPIESTAVDRTAVEAISRANSSGIDFNLLEEEFQVQLALAISASDPDSTLDAESAQIDAAKRISLRSCPVVPVDNADSLAESLSFRYWSYSVVNYNEKVMDGFYDVCGFTTNSVVQGNMPLLVDLQAISISENVDYEVIMKMADVVVDRMGGPVSDADEMSSRWRRRSKELQNTLNSIILPLGCLDVGLSCHRALLFKVIADMINLPCMLVKGSYYTGTDDGAVNLIKMDDGSEYIIDLMGAPGTLIPPEVPSSHLPTAGFDISGFGSLTETPKDSTMKMGEGSGVPAVSPILDRGSSTSGEGLYVSIQTNENDLNLVEKNQIEKFEYDFGKLSLSGSEKPSSAQKIKVKNVSKYVISAAKNPEFAQKLHAVLLESGASPPADLFTDMNLGESKLLEKVHPENRVNLGVIMNKNGLAEGSADELRKLNVNISNSDFSFPSDVTSEGFVLVNNRTNEKLQIDTSGLDMASIHASGMAGSAMHENLLRESTLFSELEPCQLRPEHALVSSDYQCIQEKTGRFFNMETGKESDLKSMETENSGLHTTCNGYSERINPMLGEVAEWEIPWEDLEIGERIGIGSYGEVYHGDWNGTEVAVKKFLDQGFSGDALVQFRCEAEIMLRLRHPNVVLFMGAVTRPPHLSILTEFLPRGSLYRLLHRPNSQIDEKRRMQMALDVAKGMNYLHTSHPTIVHRDLKSPNLLVNKNWLVKVCDFGLSRIKHHTFLSSKSTAGTPEWMAPEVLRNEPANEKCDIYSFGVILWELATCQIPWKGLNPMQVVGAVGFQNRHLEIPEYIDPAIAQIIRDCWQLEPNLRPSFAQLITRLRRVQHLLVETTNHTNQTAD